MTLHYWMIMERYLELNKVVGGLIYDYEIYSLLDGKKTSQVATFWPLIDSIFLEQPSHIHPLLRTLHMTFDFAL